MSTDTTAMSGEKTAMSTETANLLLEIGTEELPPKALLQLIQALESSIVEGLHHNQLAHGEVCPFATPRRLALTVSNLQLQADDQKIELLGPPAERARCTRRLRRPPAAPAAVAATCLGRHGAAAMWSPRAPKTELLSMRAGLRTPRTARPSVRCALLHGRAMPSATRAVAVLQPCDNSQFLFPRHPFQI